MTDGTLLSPAPEWEGIAPAEQSKIYEGEAALQVQRKGLERIFAIGCAFETMQREAMHISHSNQPTGIRYNQAWASLERPVPGLARVTAALSTPVAGGEYVWGIVPFRHMVEARSVDVVMIDLVRVGGITQWLKVAGMAEVFNLPVVSHLIPEVHVHLIGAIPNGLTVEYMPWLAPLFEEVPEQQNGELVMPAAPGLGLKFNKATLDRYRVA